MRGALLTIAACLALVIAGCGDDSSTSTSTAESPTTTTEQGSQEGASDGGSKTKPKVTVPQGPPPKSLVKNDLEVGTGPTAKAGDRVTVHYVGVGYESGEEFDSSWGKEWLPFTLGAGEVIPGWDRGVEGMKVGGRRELVIPPDLAYGPEGFPPAIGPNETLIFVVDLLSTQ